MEVDIIKTKQRERFVLSFNRVNSKSCAIGPLQLFRPVILVQKRYAEEQGAHWDKTNKALI